MGAVEAQPAEQHPAEGDSVVSRVLKGVTENTGKVLIVEDEAELAEVLEFNLLRQGYQVLVAYDGLEACRLIGREKPDLILLDLMLPLLNGWEICRMVRAHQDPLVAKTPIIMLSALGSTDDRIKGYDLGADLYFPKPYAMKEVLVKVQQLIARQREYQQLTKKMMSLRSWADMQDQWQQALFHELRNQLTIITGMAVHLRKNSELPQERSEQFAEQISNSSHYLGALAENYLLVRQVEEDHRQLQGEPILLSEILAELKPLFAPLAEQKACQLRIDCPDELLLHLHPIGLKVILSSLLDNALKYSMLDGHIDLQVVIDEEKIKIFVEDDGPGVAEEDREKIFAKFYRGRGNRDKPTGTGLGLYMARTLTEAMGGTLSLLDTHEPGCCFELNWPIG
jgi:signal transduction histidine kinase